MTFSLTWKKPAQNLFAQTRQQDRAEKIKHLPGKQKQQTKPEQLKSRKSFAAARELKQQKKKAEKEQ